MSAPAAGGPKRPASLQKNPRLSQWLRIRRDGTVWITSGKIEIGQGILTALAQIAAEELDIDPGRIRMLAAATDRSPDEGVTSGSLSIQDSGAALRLACAQARALLLERAAQQLGVAAAQLRVEDGTISAGAQRTTYWDLAEEGLLEREIEGTPAAKPAREYRLVGSSAARLDLPDKIAGRPRFIQDMVLPGMCFGRVVRAPRGLARLAALDRSALDPMPGVVLVHEASFAGVLAEREEQAVKAMHSLRDHSRWEPATSPPGDIGAWLKAHVAESRVISEKEDAAAAKRALATIEATYTKPYVAHASIGPSCAIAQWSGDTLTVWSHSQGIFNLRRDLALALGIAEDDVVVKHVEGAGCYGHNGADDVALDAALLARSSGGRPVKVQWMREDEFGWEPFGPAMAFALKASLDAGGNIVRWQHELWSNGHSHRPGVSASPTLIAASHLARPFERGSAVNPPLPAGGAERNAIPLYEFPNQRVTDHYVREMPARTSALRSLGAYGNVFAIESFMDELARAAQIDPIAFRLRHLKDPRALDVIRAAAQRARWSEWTRGEGRGHGIGFAKYKNLGAYCAVIAEVAAETEVRVARLVIAVDAGLVVNPDGLVNQIEGGAIQSTSWTLKEQVRFDAEGIASLGWEDYPILKFSEVPAVEVAILNRPEMPSSGVGEAAQGPTAAAIANALQDALGVRVRDLPLDREHILAAMG